ncbi:MAG: DUF3192 domain-containing protein [Lentisphaerae bacterium]|nr:DUF3192 domain-containing protein [Lentisphaerota bacterium]MCP4100032.1 DUF3192 domain-containing protein [Lentisphaerota bacterium]
MKRMIILAIVAAMASFSMTGCAYFDVNEASRNIENSKKLRIGMTKAQVLKVMGEPLRDEIYNKPNVWYYYTQCLWHDCMKTQDECMPLIFKDGKLIGWGNKYLERMQLEHEFSK